MSTSSTVLSIGPADAVELLKNRQHQRRVSPRTVARYARDMREGRWRLTAGNPLAIWEDLDGEWGSKGELHVLNGQHRLLAIIEANLELEFWVVYEDDPNTFMTYDNGLTRTIGTMVGLAIGGENAQAISVMSGMVLQYERHPKTMWTGTLVSKSEIVEWVEQQDRERLNQCIRDYGSLRAAVKELGHWYSALNCLVHMHSAHANRWLEFHEGVVHGENLQSGDPRLTLRNYLIRGQRSRGDRWERQVGLAVGIKAWNSYVAGVPRQHLMFRRDELDKSGMPAVQ